MAAKKSKEVAPTQFLFGYQDEKGKIAIPAKFEQAFEFEGEIARAKADGKTGLIDEKGNWILKPAFEFIGRAENGYVAHRAGAKWGLADLRGKEILKAQFDDIKSIGRAVVSVKLNGKFHIWKFDGTPVASDLLEVGRWYEGVTMAKTDAGCGLIDESGKWILESGPRAIYDFCEGLAAFDAEGGSGYYDHRGQIAIPQKFETAYDFSEGLARVRVDGKFGYIDKTGKVVIKPEWEDPTRINFSGNTDAMANFVNGYALCARPKGDFLEAGILDRDGKWHDKSEFPGDPRAKRQLKSVRLENPAWTEFQEGLELGPAFDKKIAQFSEKLEAALEKDEANAVKIIKEISAHDFGKGLAWLKMIVWDMNDYGLVLYPVDEDDNEFSIDSQKAFFEKERAPFKNVSKLYEKGLMEDPKSPKGVKVLNEHMKKWADRHLEWFAELWKKNAGKFPKPVRIGNEDDGRLLDVKTMKFIDD